MRRFYMILAAASSAALFSLNAVAQTIDPTVEIVRKYDVSIDDKTKPVIPASVDDSIYVFGRNFDYSIFNRPIANLYDFTPYDALQLKVADPQRYPFFNIRLGCQYPFTPSADVHLQRITHSGLYFSLSGRHNSYFGELPAAIGQNPLDAGKLENDVRADFKYAWTSGELDLTAGYAYDDYSFKEQYGLSQWNRRQSFNVGAALRSAHKEDNSLYYAFRANVRRTDSDYLFGLGNAAVGDTLAIGETRLDFHGRVGTTFDVHRVYLNMNIKYVSYDKLKDYTLGIVEFSPMYEYDKGIFSGRLGVRFGNHFGILHEGVAEAEDGNNLKPWSNIFPDIDARLRIVKDYLWLHAVISGGNEMNAYTDMIAQVPYLVPNAPLYFGTRAFDSSLTLESVVFGRIAVNLKGSYVVNRDKALFAPDMDPASSDLATSSIFRLNSYFRDINTLSAGVEAFWKSESLTTGGEFLRNWYTSYDKMAVTELPAMTARLYARYDFRERFIAGVEYNFRSAISGSQFGAYEVPAVHNLDANVNYVLNRHFMFYLKAANILNMRNQYVPLYVEPGLNIGGGVTITL